MTDTMHPSRATAAAPSPPGVDVRGTVDRALEVVRPSFPLADFVASNPLHRLEHLPFDEAVRAGAPGSTGYLSPERYEQLHRSGRISVESLAEATRRHDDVRAAVGTAGAPPGTIPTRTLTEVLDLAEGTRSGAEVDSLVARWCAAYLDRHQATWSMPRRELGLFGAWRHLARHDRGLRVLVGRDGVRAIQQLPGDPLDALAELVGELGDQGPDDLVAYHRRALGRLPGWVAALERHDGTTEVQAYLAIRLAVEVGVVRRRGHSPDSLAERSVEVVDRPPRDPVGGPSPEVWQEALERSYRDHLLDQIVDDAADPADAAAATAQVVTCIDVRSEGLRRHLEDVGGYDTVGFAGFFGLAVRIRGLDDHDGVASCPVIVRPAATVAEVPRGRDDARSAREGVSAVGGACHGATAGGAAPFAFVEGAGWILGPLAALATFAPRLAHRARLRLARTVAPTPPTRLQVDRHHEDGPAGLALPERVAAAAAALRGMGIAEDAAALVVICGHHAASANNPYAAALDCGACGGHSGAPNARALVEVLNDPMVRAGLREEGIRLPASTWFVAAVHETTTDTVSVLDREDVPDSHLERLARLEDDLLAATRGLRDERGRDLPGGSGGPRRGSVADSLRRRSSDWAEPVPELGLAGNAAVVVGPRSLTRGVDLGRRVFLHSYDHGADPDGTQLAGILSGPLVVGHMISSQYYFASVDPHRFGAGTKPLHNVVGGTGILEGAGGDLRLGLPLESVVVGDEPVHEPLRLLAVVDAPAPLLGRLAERDEVARNLVLNGWVRLVARPDPDERDALGADWVELGRDGAWRPCGPSTIRDS